MPVINRVAGAFRPDNLSGCEMVFQADPGTSESMALFIANMPFSLHGELIDGPVPHVGVANPY